MKIDIPEQNPVTESLIANWRKDETAPFSGWDFSYLQGRWQEDLPDFDYEERAKELLAQSTSGLDMGTGGGEFLASLGVLPKSMVATENWEPNVAVAQARLAPLGVDVSFAKVGENLQFADGSFDVVINRQAAFTPLEVTRVLQKGGRFITQQVSGDNLADLAREFGVTSKFIDRSIDIIVDELEQCGLRIDQKKEWTGEMTFNDIGALVYFLKNVPWVVPDFSVEKYKGVLLRLQKRIDAGERLAYTQKRFFVEAAKSDAEALEQIAQRREGEDAVEYLRRLEGSGRFLFHGSHDEIEILEPRDPVTDATGDADNKVLAVYAYSSAALSVQRAIVNRANLDSEWEILGGTDPNNQDVPLLATTPNLVLTDGFVYVLPRGSFRKTGGYQWISESPIAPIKTIKVNPKVYSDLGGVHRSI